MSPDRRRRRKAMLRWANSRIPLRWPQFTALADSLTCEAAPDDAIPRRHRKAVTEFRHLNSAARLAVCWRYLTGSL